MVAEGLLHADTVKSDLHPGAAAQCGPLARASTDSAAKLAGAPAGTPARGEGSSRWWALPRLRALQAQRLTRQASVAQVLGKGERRVVTREQQN